MGDRFKHSQEKMVMLCQHCNVNLCHACWRLFHETPNLVAQKARIKQMMIKEQQKTK